MWMGSTSLAAFARLRRIVFQIGVSQCGRNKLLSTLRLRAIHVFQFADIQANPVPGLHERRHQDLDTVREPARLPLMIVKSRDRHRLLRASCSDRSSFPAAFRFSAESPLSHSPCVFFFAFA